MAFTVVDYHRPRLDDVITFPLFSQNDRSHFHRKTRSALIKYKISNGRKKSMSTIHHIISSSFFRIEWTTRTKSRFVRVLCLLTCYLCSLSY